MFLDRDGVLNLDKGYVSQVQDFEWTEGAKEAVLWAKEEGWTVVVVTNQSGIGRGYYTEADFLALSDWMVGEVEVDAVYYCPHHPDEHCPARKPGTRMLESARRDFGSEPALSVLVGDKDSDMEAARRFGSRGLRFPGGDLLSFLKDNLTEETS